MSKLERVCMSEWERDREGERERERGSVGASVSGVPYVQETGEREWSTGKRTREEKRSGGER